MATLKQAKKLLSIFEETAGDHLQVILGSGLLADVRDADLGRVNRDEVRRALSLLPLVPAITITVTGNEEVQLPDWVRKLEEDATEPVGTLELEIIELLEPNETRISGEEMCRRAKAKQADLGLRHAQAFLAKYREEGFGLPAGTYITFPGTVVIDRRGSRRVPYLYWLGGVWSLFWDWLERDWSRYGRLVRPRA